MQPQTSLNPVSKPSETQTLVAWLKQLDTSWIDELDLRWNHQTCSNMPAFCKHLRTKLSYPSAWSWCSTCAGNEQMLMPLLILPVPSHIDIVGWLFPRLLDQTLIFSSSAIPQHRIGVASDHGLVGVVNTSRNNNGTKCFRMFRSWMCNLPTNNIKQPEYPEASSWVPNLWQHPGSPRSPAPLRLRRRKAAASSALCFSEPSLTSSVSLLLTLTSLGQISGASSNKIQHVRKAEENSIWLLAYKSTQGLGWNGLNFQPPLTRAPVFLRGSLVDQRLRMGTEAQHILPSSGPSSSIYSKKGISIQCTPPGKLLRRLRRMATERSAACFSRSALISSFSLLLTLAKINGNHMPKSSDENMSIKLSVVEKRQNFFHIWRDSSMSWHFLHCKIMHDALVQCNHALTCGQLMSACTCVDCQQSPFQHLAAKRNTNNSIFTCPWFFNHPTVPMVVETLGPSSKLCGQVFHLSQVSRRVSLFVMWGPVGDRPFLQRSTWKSIIPPGGIDVEATIPGGQIPRELECRKRLKDWILEWPLGEGHINEAVSNHTQPGPDSRRSFAKTFAVATTFSMHVFTSVEPNILQKQLYFSVRLTGFHNLTFEFEEAPDPPPFRSWAPIAGTLS